MININHSKKAAEYIYKVINDKNITDIEVLEVGELTTLADIFMIVKVPNSRLAVALCDEIEQKLKLQGYEIMGKEGYNTARWILLDYQGVIVHIFHKDEAEFYRLDRLWKDAKTLEFNIK